MPARYTITAALPYANGPLHIGHIAGAYLPADIYVRYLRLRHGRGKVAFICGSDEHGVPITLRARKEGRSPQDVVDTYHQLNKKSFAQFGIDFDFYHRTSDQLHHQTAADFFKKLYADGVFTAKEEKQYYDPKEKTFLADRYITGGCPRCGHEEAYGDQCEKCGATLSPRELKNPRSAISGKEPVLKETKHWYLPLDKMQAEWLEAWINSHKKDWKPNVYGQCKSWLDQGLRPRAVTRDLDWGVQVPLDEAKGKVLYVWFDAPIGYISATKAWAAKNKQDWKPWWQEEDTKLVHFIGKDNIVFHCLIFPAMLKAHGNYILPDNVPSNEFLNLEGKKLSTSRNWAVWLHEYLEDFPGKEDVLRYVLTANAPETSDSDFSWKDFCTRNNSELVGILGNFVNRTLVLTHKYFDGRVPELTGAQTKEVLQNPLFKDIRTSHEEVTRLLEAYRFREAQQAMMALARAGNRYLTEEEPWKKFKTQEAAVRYILFVCLQVVAALGVLMEPFLPHTARRLLQYLRLSSDARNWNKLPEGKLWLESGHIIDKPDLLFEKLDAQVVEKQREKLRQHSRDNAPKQKQKQAKPMIDIDTFGQLDLQVGKITEAEKVDKADKLLKLTVDTGGEARTVVSGIAEQFRPEKLLHKQVVLVANLKPTKIRGIRSEGMILMAEDETGKLAFVAPDRKMQEGSKVR